MTDRADNLRYADSASVMTLVMAARDRAGRFFRVDRQIQALSRPDLQAAADELLARLRAHTR